MRPKPLMAMRVGMPGSPSSGAGPSDSGGKLPPRDRGAGDAEGGERQHSGERGLDPHAVARARPLAQSNAGVAVPWGGAPASSGVLDDAPQARGEGRLAPAAALRGRRAPAASASGMLEPQQRPRRAAAPAARRARRRAPGARSRRAGGAVAATWRAEVGGVAVGRCGWRAPWPARRRPPPPAGARRRRRRCGRASRRRRRAAWCRPAAWRPRSRTESGMPVRAGDAGQRARAVARRGVRISRCAGRRGADTEPAARNAPRR